MAAIAKRDWAAREAYIADPDTVRAVLRDGRFSPGGFTAYLDGLAARGMPLAHLQAMARHSFIFLSGRRHLALRRSVAPFLSAAAIAARQPLLEAAVADALQRLAAAEDPDLVSDFVEPAFLKVVRAVIGLAGGEDVAVLDAVRIANDATEPLLPLGELRRIDKAMGTLSTHLAQGPPPAGSLLGGLAPPSAPLDPLGGPVNTALSALIAAYTMAQTLAFVLEGLLSGPLDAWADAAAPDWADRHLERNLSLYFATLTLARVSETAADVGGCPVAARRTVVLDMVRANEALRIRSPQAPAHLSFGAGVHKCPGEALARAFLATAVPRIAARYPRLTLQRDGVRHRLTSIVQFPDRLPAVLETVDRRLSRRLYAVRNPETARQIVNNDDVFAPPPMARHLEALQAARSDLNLSTALRIARNAPFLISGPRHAEIRRLVSSVLGGNRLAGWEPHFASTLEATLSTLDGADTVDLVDGFADPFFRAAIKPVIGIETHDHAAFDRLAPKIQRVLSPWLSLREILRVQDTMAALLGLMGIPQGASAPPSLLATLARDPPDGFEIDDLKALALVLYGASFNVKHTLSNVLFALLRLPTEARRAQCEAIATPAGVERWIATCASPKFIYRVARHDVALGEEPIAAMTTTRLELDPINRGVEIGHLAFGHGLHRCLGAALSRRLIRLGVPALLARHPAIRLDPQRHSFAPMSQTVALERLPCRLAPI